MDSDPETKKKKIFRSVSGKLNRKIHHHVSSPEDALLKSKVKVNLKNDESGFNTFQNASVSSPKCLSRNLSFGSTQFEGQEDESEEAQRFTTCINAVKAITSLCERSNSELTRSTSHRNTILSKTKLLKIQSCEIGEEDRSTLEPHFTSFFSSISAFCDTERKGEGEEDGTADGAFHRVEGASRNLFDMLMKLKFLVASGAQDGEKQEEKSISSKMQKKKRRERRLANGGSELHGSKPSKRVSRLSLFGSFAGLEQSNQGSPTSDMINLGKFRRGKSKLPHSGSSFAGQSKFEISSPLNDEKSKYRPELVSSRALRLRPAQDMFEKVNELVDTLCNQLLPPYDQLGTDSPNSFSAISPASSPVPLSTTTSQPISMTTPSSPSCYGIYSESSPSSSSFSSPTSSSSATPHSPLSTNFASLSLPDSSICDVPRMIDKVQKQFQIIADSCICHDPNLSFSIDQSAKAMEEMFRKCKMHQKFPTTESYEAVFMATRKFQDILRSLRHFLFFRKKKGDETREEENTSLQLLEEFIENRKKAVDEIIETERSYLEKLVEFENICIEPLRQSIICESNESEETQDDEKFVTKEVFEAMFGMVGVITKISRDHLKEMEVAQKDRSQLFGTVFVRLCPWLKHYAVYVNSYDDSVKTIKEARKKNSKLSAFLRSAEKQSPSHYDLSSYRILPVQRLGRYELLLKRLLEFTPSCHPDYEELQTALKNVTDINQKINKYKKAEENRRKVSELSSKFAVPPKPPLDSDGKMLLHEGEVDLVSQKKSGKIDAGYCVLFDSILMLCKFNRESKLEKKYVFVFEDGGMSVEQVSDSKLKELGDRPMLVLVGKSSSKIIAFENELRKKSWMKALSRYVD